VVLNFRQDSNTLIEGLVLISAKLYTVRIKILSVSKIGSGTQTKTHRIMVSNFTYSYL
jgi:hypothetical protein